MIRIEHGDMLDVIPSLVAEGIVADAIVTDPPYGLKFMGKRWDNPGAFVERQPDRSVKFDRIGGNHNPTSSTDIARTRRVEGDRQEAWHKAWAQEAYHVLRPGGYLLAFGGTRTYHRMVSGVEAAGFVIQDAILWLYGSGFPKRRDMLKPAVEIICVAYRPGGKRTLQVDECKVQLSPGEGAFEREDEGSQETRYADRANVPFSPLPGRRIGSPGWGGPNKRLSVAPGQEGKLVPRSPPAAGGRWPANVCLSVPEDEYELRPNVTTEQRSELFRWLSENP